MKLFELLNAYRPLRALCEIKFTSFKKARELSILLKKVEFEADFYIKEEKKIVETYAKRNEKGEPIILEGGRIELKDEKAKLAFEKEINELRNTEVESLPKVILSASDFSSSASLSPSDILSLEAVIDFKEEES